MAKVSVQCQSHLYQYRIFVRWLWSTIVLLFTYNGFTSILISLQTITMKHAFTVKISIILFIYIQAHIRHTCCIFLLWFVDVFMIVQRKLKMCLYYVVHSLCARTSALNSGTLVLMRHVLGIKRMSFNCAYFVVALTVCVILRSVVPEVK